MTNKEFYFDKLLAFALENACGKLNRDIHGESCVGKDCKDCEFYTVENIEKWLNAEHEEPPRLQNGDGLKPGSRIMVRNDDKENWTKRVFMCFIYGYFVCVCDKDYIGHDGNYQLWKQARLTEDGE